MGPTNIVAHELESHGVCTFSAKEMAFNILGLMHPLLFSITQVEPIWADLNGGMDCLPGLADITTHICSKLNKKADLHCAIASDNSADFKIISRVAAEHLFQPVNVLPRAYFCFESPSLEATSSLQDLAHLQGLIDLNQVVVITWFAEVGPWGSSCMRWEMEAWGEFTIKGCIEMVWIMRFIKHFNGWLKDGLLYVGWVDSKANEPVDDKEVKGRYENDILLHAGICLIGKCYKTFLFNLTLPIRTLYEGAIHSLSNPNSNPSGRPFQSPSHSSQPSFILPVPLTTSYWSHCGHITLSLLGQDSLTALESETWWTVQVRTYLIFLLYLKTQFY